MNLEQTVTASILALKITQSPTVNDDLQKNVNNYTRIVMELTQFAKSGGKLVCYDKVEIYLVYFNELLGCRPC